MDSDGTQQPPMNGDEELAKALDGGLQFEETPAGGGLATPPSLTPAPAGQMGDPLAGLPTPPLAANDDPKPADDAPKAEAYDDQTTDEPGLPSVHHTHDDIDHPTSDSTDHTAGPPPSTGNPELDGIKASALAELKPLVGKLKLSPEEKFDTLLLVIRSTDDQSLLDEAHKAAKDIEDETKRAQALLDIIKEVDYFSAKH